MSKTIVLVPQELIENKIMLINGQKVMLDRDLATIYGAETRALNQAVKRNIDRFPSDFMFKLTRQQIMNLSQFVTSSSIKHAPNVSVFTEQGIAMLSSVLNSKRAIQVNIQIMRTFTKLRELLGTHKALRTQIESLERKYAKHDQDFQIVFAAIKRILAAPKPRFKKTKPIGFIRA